MQLRFRIKRGGLLRRQWRWTLQGTNGEVIAVSELYKNRADCAATVDLIINAAQFADVVWEDA